MMTEARLQYVAKKVDNELNEIENSKLKEIGHTRKHYEKIADNLTQHATNKLD